MRTLNLLIVVGLVFVLTGIAAAAEGMVAAPMDSGTTENLISVWGSGPNDVFAVGEGGTILHYGGTGNTWSPMVSGTGVYLSGIWGTGTNNVYAVGASGTILRYNGAAWAKDNSPVLTSNLHFHAVWGNGPNDVYAVGEYTGGGGGIVHWDGTEWSNDHGGAIIGPLGFLQFDVVWGRGQNEVFVSGHTGYSSGVEGAVYEYDGSGWKWWRDYPPTDYQHDKPRTRSMKGTWGTSSELFLIGETYGGGDAVVLHYNGSAWQTPPQVFGDSESFRGLAGTGATADGVFAVGHNGKIVRYDGTDWSDIPSGTTVKLMEVWASSPDNAFTVGVSGTILHIIPEPATVSLLALGGLAVLRRRRRALK